MLEACEIYGLDAPDIEKQGKASREFSSPEEAKASGKVSDAKFSIEFVDDIANKQRKSYKAPFRQACLSCLRFKCWMQILFHQFPLTKHGRNIYDYV